jgi:L-alanine-DL-glutamate epimerase-like enolase superfamily enzyme
MKITDVKVVLHERTTETLAVFGVSDGRLPMGVLCISTDAGITGYNFLTYPGPGPDAIAQQIVRFVKPVLVGEDPLDIGRHWKRISGMLHLSPITLGVVDVALWDIAGKVAGLPIHRLLGTSRDRIPVYYSSGHHPRGEDYADEALYWQQQGWKGYKLHPARAPWRAGAEAPVRTDIEFCSAVREAVGNEMKLMLDSSWSYSYTEALEVGRGIEELAYHWYEDPLAPHDIYGYSRLKRYLSIPILATETTLGGLDTLPQWITERATDFLRGDVVIKGGITGMMKIAHLAEAFHMNCEVHDAYNALNNVAGQHVIMAITNCNWYEIIAFNRAGDHDLEHISYGLAEPLEIDRDGYLHAPTAPGLGVEIDWDLINSKKSGEIS